MYKPQSCSANKEERRSNNSNDENDNDETEQNIKNCLYNI